MEAQAPGATVTSAASGGIEQPPSFAAGQYLEGPPGPTGPAGGVSSVNGQTGAVNLDSRYGGAIPILTPEQYGAAGNATTGTDGTKINEAIQALAGRGQAGKVLLTGRYALDVPIVVLPGVTLEWAGGAGWQSASNDWTGYCCPGPNFSGAALVEVGAAGEQGANPDGARLLTPSLIGKTPAGTVVAGLSGIVVTDTANVEIDKPSIRYMDNGGTTGMGIRFYATVAAGTQDCKIIGGILHGCAIGLDMDNAVGVTAGCTDNRLIGVTFEPLGADSACAVRLGNSGASGAGSGTFLTDVHMTLGSSSSGHELIIGSGVKKTVLTACYLDVCEAEAILNQGIGLQVNGGYFQASTNATGIKAFINQQEGPSPGDLSPGLRVIGATFYPNGLTNILGIAQFPQRTGASQAVFCNVANNTIDGQGAPTSHIVGACIDSAGTAFTPSTAAGNVSGNVWAAS